MHEPKFAWNEPGSSSELVLRYDQLQCVTSDPSSLFPPPYRTMIDETGRLPSDPEKRVPVFQRPRWDGLAYIVYGDEADVERTLVQEKFANRIVADEQTVFRKVSRGLAREFILVPSERHRDPVSLVKIRVRQPRLSREEFQDHLLNGHAPLILAQAATNEFVRRYAQLHTTGTTQEDPEAERMDAISVLSFASLNDVEDYLVSPEHDAIAASEAKLCGDGSEWWTAIRHSVVNRLMPELATVMPERLDSLTL